MSGTRFRRTGWTQVLDAWGSLRQVRELASKRIEEKRERKELGSSLQAELDIQAHGPATKPGAPGRRPAIRADRFERCAATTPGAPGPNHREGERQAEMRALLALPSDVDDAGLCGRCESNLRGSGEPRRYA
jgi:isoleucyl-tRNA synthetase